MHARVVLFLDVAVACLPWCVKIFRERCDEEFSKFLEDVSASLQSVCENKHWMEALSPLSTKGGGGSDIVATRVQRLSEVLVNIQEAGDDWECLAVPTPQTAFETRLLVVNEVELQNFAVPGHSKVSRYAPPRFHLSLLQSFVEKFDKSEQKSEAKKSIADKLIVGDYVTDVLDTFVSDHTMGAIRLNSLPVPLTLTNDVIEGILSEMLSLPSSPQPLAYYSVVLLDLCNTEGSTSASHLKNAVFELYSRSSQLDCHAFDTLAEWLAYHLSNFAFEWNWDDLMDALGSDPGSFKERFCRGILRHCVMLYDVDEVLKMIPENVQQYMPPSQTPKDEEEMDEATFGPLEDRSLIIKVVTGKGKLPGSEVESYLKEVIKGDDVMPRLRPLFASILRGGCRTFSHFDIVVERYIDLVRGFVEEAGEEARRLLVRQVLVFWAASEQHVAYIFDKLLKLKLVDGGLFLQEVFVNEDDTALLQSRMEEDFTWHLARSVFRRLVRNLAYAKQEVMACARFASSAAEGQMAEAEERLQKSQEQVNAISSELKDILLFVFGRLIGVYQQISASDAMSDGERWWSWRILGFLKELGRSNGELLLPLLEVIEQEAQMSSWETNDSNTRLIATMGIVRMLTEADLLAHL
mmetsp:Transcript_407/g.1203  ORF Transcript_407/g.1203 Transcript_407/m.1203 type:complete len:636 (+) Transcript_407:673-2580(+)